MKAEWIINYFKGSDVFIIGGGASLSGFDFNKLKGKRIICINHAWRWIQPEILVFLDACFNKEMKVLGIDLYSLPFKIVAGANSGMKTEKNCTVVNLTSSVSKNPNAMYGRQQSGLIAINLCLIANAKRIFLLGFDGKFTNGQGHFFSKEYPHRADNNEKSYTRSVEAYEKYRVYQNIYNCNLDSNFKMFKTKSIDEVLNEDLPYNNVK